jgi:transcriptional regulator with XRE-family HTH domain
MGRASREKPARLPEKLKQIREALGLSQNQMLAQLGLNNSVERSAVSGFENARREPSLIIVLKYARLAGISSDILIDDELDLPEPLPSASKHKNTD